MEFSIDEKLALAKDMCNKNYRKTHYFSYIYPFTTENIAGYLPYFDFQNKSVLTIGSSCDQALNAILCGANLITILDICPFTREYYYLKKAALMSLTLDEFLKFFGCMNYPIIISSMTSFSLDLYLKIKKSLKIMNEEVGYFWDEIFKNYNGMIIQEQLFSTDIYDDEKTKTINKYLKDDNNYFELRQKIAFANINFIYGDIFDFLVNESYDNILLSNLATYYSIDKMLTLFNKLEPLLNDNGKMLITYLYQTTANFSQYKEDEPEIYDLLKVFNKFPKEVTLESFVETRGILFNMPWMKDSILMYKKVKKI